MNKMRKPRLAESGDQLHDEILKLSLNGVVTADGVRYPALRIVLMPPMTIRHEAGRPVYYVIVDGICITPASAAQIQTLHNELDNDGVDVFAGDVCLHSASGNHFQPEVHQ